jgi:hypothetical protein
MRRYVAKQRWRLLLQSIQIIQRSTSHFIPMQLFPRFHLSWYPTGSSAERSIQDRIQTHQENKEELSLIPRAPPSPRRTPAWERSWDTSRPSLFGDYPGQFEGLDFHTSVAVSRDSLTQPDSLEEDLLGMLGGLDLNASIIMSRGSLTQLHPSYEIFRKEFEGSDFHTSVAVSQGSLSQLDSLDEYFREAFE